MTVDCDRPTQSIHCNVGQKCFFLILSTRLFVTIVMHLYFIHISQGSVETHLRCGGIYNNHIIAKFSGSVTVKKFENRSMTGENIDKSKVPRFLFFCLPATL